ncbi:hypothetical protein COOONC_21258 [Cooperia oncophora]
MVEANNQRCCVSPPVHYCRKLGLFEDRRFPVGVVHEKCAEFSQLSFYKLAREALLRICGANGKWRELRTTNLAEAFHRRLGILMEYTILR